uniref:VOC domain-containing protein n=1 Tax=Alexandrium andersonii TaxID=327968 RepID=A0A7S2BPG8_9DINO|mmetsp:Transcript_28408/g.64457  ORF Transcript_28408/g.64457 Transcript_28408/m.64457 type:complete len:146 (+) Transcript_28408:1-438(+)
MHGVPGAKHCFLEAGNGFELSFVQVDDPPPRAAEPGVEIPRHLQHGLDDGRQMPGGTMAHVALRCRDAEELKAMRKQIKDAGVAITPIVDHGFCYSAYFQDPNGFQLELCTTYRSYIPEEEVRTPLLDQKVPKETTGRLPIVAKL